MAAESPRNSPQQAPANPSAWQELRSVFDRDLAADALAAVVGAFALGWLSSEAVFIGAFLGGTMSRLVRRVVRRWKTPTIWRVSGAVGLWDIRHLVGSSSQAAGTAGVHASAGAAAQGVAVLAVSACAAGTVTAAQPILPDPLRSRDARGVLQVGGDPVDVAIDRPGQHATLTFTGRQGDRVTAVAPAVDLAGGESARVIVRDPSDRWLTSGHVSADDPELGPSETLPATGTYTMLVEPDHAATGSFALRLVRTP